MGTKRPAPDDDEDNGKTAAPSRRNPRRTGNPPRPNDPNDAGPFLDARDPAPAVTPLTDPQPPFQPREITPDRDKELVWHKSLWDPDLYITAEEQVTWLDNVEILKDAETKNLVSTPWQGIRILGIGGGGLVGLWQKPIDGKMVQLAVKQSRDKFSNEQLQNESRMLAELTARGAVHVVKLWKAYFEQPGRGTSDYDEQDLPLGRIYLEYCDMGSMLAYIKNMYLAYPPSTPLPEVFIWRIFECLAKGLCMLENGREDNTNPKWDKIPIAHLDLKPDNIFISRATPEHPDYHIFKIGDLGVSKHISPNPAKSVKNYIFARPGTDEYWSPEMAKRILNPAPDFATQQNVWQIGESMYELIMRGRRAPGDYYYTVQIQDAGQVRQIGTFGAEINKRSEYSATLRSLVMCCLTLDPSHRPSPEELLTICEGALAAIGGLGVEPVVMERIDHEWLNPSDDEDEDVDMSS